ncbi:hypothetical protein TNCV_192461 [Trichonephila clavipes]|nr:hypothetical protein TNCV_192461 [Trichonephila clavipes]
MRCVPSCEKCWMQVSPVPASDEVCPPVCASYEMCSCVSSINLKETGGKRKGGGKRTRESGRENGRKEEEGRKRERRRKETERKSGRERVKPALNGEKG